MEPLSLFKVCRYFAVIKPMKIAGIDRRGRTMLILAWCCSMIFSVPQSFIFHVEHHPNITDYVQCVSFNSFANEMQDLIYSILGGSLMYALPLCIIIFCYASIYVELYRRSKTCMQGRICHPGDSSIRIVSILEWFCVSFRTLPTIERRRAESGQEKDALDDHHHCHRVRRLLDAILHNERMVSLDIFFIASIFSRCQLKIIQCIERYWIDRESALKVDQRIQKGLFLFACTNSCMNPIVYGLFNIPRKHTRHQMVSRVNI